MGWERRRLRKLSTQGDYEAWIAASDLPDEKHLNRPSAHAWEIRQLASNGTADADVFPSDAAKSSQNKGYATGAYRVAEATPNQSSVNIISTSKYIVGAINEWLPKWRKNGWRGSDGSVAYKELWQAFDSLCKRRGIDVTAEYPVPEDTRSIEIIERLRETARVACQDRARELGLPIKRLKRPGAAD